MMAMTTSNSMSVNAARRGMRGSGGSGERGASHRTIVTAPDPASQTRRAVDDMNRRRSRPFELGHEHVLGALTSARTAVADLVHADPAEIALATNTSFGLGMAARALPFRPGDIVLVSHREFPANVYPWMRLGDRGVQLELVPVTPEGWPDEGRILLEEVMRRFPDYRLVPGGRTRILSATVRGFSRLELQL